MRAAISHVAVTPCCCEVIRGAMEDGLCLNTGLPRHEMNLRRFSLGYEALQFQSLACCWIVVLGSITSQSHDGLVDLHVGQSLKKLFEGG